MTSETLYTFIIDTEQYSGNFERQMTAYMTAQIGDCEVGEELVDDALESLSKDKRSPAPCGVVSFLTYRPGCLIMVQKVECNGLHCWADSVRLLSANYWHQEVALLSLFGPRNAVRAAWARLSGKVKHASLTLGDELHLKLAETEKYVTIQTPMSRQMLHVVLIHPAATHQYSAFAPQFLQIGPEPEVGYFSRLNRMCPIPFRPAWREPLWRIGLENKLITPLPGFGIPGYMVQTTDVWAPFVKQHILDGSLT